VLAFTGAEALYADIGHFGERVIIVSIETERVPYVCHADRLLGMNPWRKRLFLTLARNAAYPVGYFQLPDDRTATVGERVAL
jgi:K+ transporter